MEQKQPLYEQRTQCEQPKVSKEHVESFISTKDLNLHYIYLLQTREFLNAKHIQIWTINEWDETPRQFDQDQGYRLPRIVTARNMCIDFAIKHDYDWLFFVDSDVLIPENTMELLFESNDFKLKSGLVHGRGAHSGAQYVFNRLGTEGDWTKRSVECQCHSKGMTQILKPDILQCPKYIPDIIATT